MDNLIYTTFGLLIVLVFSIFAVYVYSFSHVRHWKLSRQTLSNMASKKKYTNRIRSFLITVSILSIPFLLTMPNAINLSNKLAIIVGFISSVGLFVLAVTLNHPEKLVHQIAGAIFFVLLILYQAIAGISLQEYSIFLKVMAIGIPVFNLFLFIYSIFLKRFKINGIVEFQVMILGAVWILIISIYSILVI